VLFHQKSSQSSWHEAPNEDTSSPQEIETPIESLPLILDGLTSRISFYSHPNLLSASVSDENAKLFEALWSKYGVRVEKEKEKGVAKKKK